MMLFALAPFFPFTVWKCRSPLRACSPIIHHPSFVSHKIQEERLLTNFSATPHLLLSSTTHHPTMASTAPVDLKERLEVLFWQEMASYRTHDYIGAFQRREMINLSPPSNIPSSRYPTQDASAFGLEGDWSQGEQIKEHWREIICEWAYNCELLFVAGRKRPTTALLGNAWMVSDD